MPKHSDKKNLLILGASGGVASAFLDILSRNRQIIGNLVLLDKKDALLHRKNLNPQKLDAKFIMTALDVVSKKAEYHQILNENQIDIVIDLSDAPTLPIIKATNEVGVAMIDTGLNSNEDSTLAWNFLNNFYPNKDQFKNAPIIVFSGMNPGVVNMWVEFGIRKYGVPNEIVHFEYDTSMTKKWRPLVTWSVYEFLEECLVDPAGIMVGTGQVKEFNPNSLSHLIPMKDILSPIMKLRKYPSGMMALHEENMSLSLKYHIPSKFIYSVHMKTIDYLVNLEKQREVTTKDLEIGDNVNLKIEGADSIGVYLEYDDKRVYYYNSLANNDVKGRNATCTQVVVGIYAALFTLISDSAENGIHFTEELYDTPYKEFVFSTLKIEEFVFSKSNQMLKLLKHTPRIIISEDQQEKFLSFD